MSGRNLTPQEQRAWSRVARSIRRLDSPTQPSPTSPSAASGSKPNRADRSAIAQTSQQTKPITPKTTQTPPQPRLDRKVRRGQLQIDGRFDLHGLSQAEAANRLPVFLAAQRRTGSRCVLVITGKGRDGDGRLRRNVLLWLEGADARPDVSGWAPAHPKHGGAGAFYIFLKRR